MIKKIVFIVYNSLFHIRYFIFNIIIKLLKAIKNNGKKEQQEETKAFLKNNGRLLNLLKRARGTQNGNDDGIV